MLATRRSIAIAGILLAVGAASCLRLELINPLNQCTYVFGTPQFFFASLTNVASSPGGTWDAAADSNNLWSFTLGATGPSALTQNTTAGQMGSSEVAIDAGYSRLAFVSRTNLVSSPSSTWNAAETVSANLWVMNRDGTGLTALTSNDIVVGLDSAAPVFNPAGTKIAFVSSTDTVNSPLGVWDQTAHSSNLWVVNVDGTGLLPLTVNTTAGQMGAATPTFSPSGNQIAFASKTELVNSPSGVWDQPQTLSANLWVVAPAGTGLTALTQSNTLAGVDVANPVYSPAGDAIVFSSALHTVDAAAATWDTSAHSVNIWKVSPSGTGLTPLTRNTTAGQMDSITPTYSSDGLKIAFASKTNLVSSGQGTWDQAQTNSYNIWIMSPDGSHLTPLTRSDATAGVDSINPQFTPDAQKIVFSSKLNLTDAPTGLWDTAGTLSYNLWIINVDGTGLTPLTQNTLIGLDSLLTPGAHSIYQSVTCQ